MPTKAELLYEAAKTGDLTVIMELLAENIVNVNTAGISTGTYAGATALYIAAENGYSKIVNALLAAGADVNQTCTDGTTPLWGAAQRGHLTVVQRLLQVPGVDVNKPRCTGATPLFMAAQNGHAEVVSVLLPAGADVNQARTDDGVTPLFIAAQRGHLTVVQRMLQVPEIDINKSCRYTRATPLCRAAREGHSAVVNALLVAGADVNQTCTDGTPLSIATKNGFTEITNLLLVSGAARTPDEFRAALYAMTEENRQLLLLRVVNVYSNLNSKVPTTHFFLSRNNISKTSPIETRLLTWLQSLPTSRQPLVVTPAETAALHKKGSVLNSIYQSLIAKHPDFKINIFIPSSSTDSKIDDTPPPPRVAWGSA